MLYISLKLDGSARICMARLALRHEIHVFMSDNGLPVLELRDEKFMMDLAIMFDIREHLSDLNKVLHCKVFPVHRLVSTLKSFK